MKKLCTKGVLLLMLALFFNVTSSFAQTLGKPNPDFTAPCASVGANSFNVDFTWQAPLVLSDNVFVLELSDGEGNFDNPTELATVSNSNTNFDITFNFEFPTTTAGDIYTVRVRSTSPEIISEASDPFSAYHVNVDEALVLNDFDNVVLCGGAAALISVTNFPDEQLYSWYKDNVLMAGEKGPSLLINSTGNYYVEVDYGNFCSGGTASNIIQAIDGGAGSSETVSITSDGTESCDLAVDITFTSSVTDSNYTYTWYKDDVALSETSSTLVANEEGVYFLEVTIGQCPIYSNEIDITECTDIPEPPAGGVIYNVLTPNGDGINDQWILPEIYTTPEVEVVIYSATGEILRQGTSYQNDWPQATVSHIVNNPIFYYRILNGSEVLEQGSITLIK